MARSGAEALDHGATVLKFNLYKDKRSERVQTTGPSAFPGDTVKSPGLQEFDSEPRARSEECFGWQRLPAPPEVGSIRRLDESRDALFVGGTGGLYRLERKYPKHNNN